jgi:hypothetical protein
MGCSGGLEICFRLGLPPSHPISVSYTNFLIKRVGKRSRPHDDDTTCTQSTKMKARIQHIGLDAADDGEHQDSMTHARIPNVQQHHAIVICSRRRLTCRVDVIIVNVRVKYQQVNACCTQDLDRYVVDVVLTTVTNRHCPRPCRRRRLRIRKQRDDAPPHDATLLSAPAAV